MIARRRLLAAAPVAALFAHVGVRSLAGLAAPATPAASPVAGGYAQPDWLVAPDWLQSHLPDPSLTVVALTPAADFAKGHVPGAAQIDWSALNLADTSDAAIAKWEGDIETKLTRLGLAPIDSVVVYDGGTLYAPRLWWILRQLGQRDVRVLNGGEPAWSAAGAPVETGPSRVQPAAQPYRGKPDPSSLATLVEVEAALGKPNAILVDARSPREYEAGHIPGAVNVEFTRNARAANPKTWLPAADLKTMYAAAGVTPNKRVIPYCSTGVRSATTLFTLLLLGYPDVALYTGSWQEWSAHSELPRATGPKP
ncbi:MAG TPA: sulfurtransferase [Thermomicrobiales bacterium]|jgi:thiosulfate/3-mercaptopyruvate sulfurtransferase|nr:sulfurtransferase [Thermomicrobiales bacterium]